MGKNDARRTQQREASKRYHEKRKEAGMAKVTVWLPPEAREALAKLKEERGSQDAAIEEAILKLLADHSKPEDQGN